MAHIRDTHQGAPRLRITCSRCGTTHACPLSARCASDARHLARRDGWRVHNAPRRREKSPDLCPDCRKENR